MTFKIHIHVEHKVGDRWVASYKHTFEQFTSETTGVTFASMREIEAPYSSFGLFLPVSKEYAEEWQFPLRGMPADASPEVRAVCTAAGRAAKDHTFFTFTELTEIYRYLMFASPAMDFERTMMRAFIDEIPRHSPDFDSVRIIAWHPYNRPEWIEDDDSDEPPFTYESLVVLPIDPPIATKRAHKAPATEEEAIAALRKLPPAVRLQVLIAIQQRKLQELKDKQDDKAKPRR